MSGDIPRRFEIHRRDEFHESQTKMQNPNYEPGRRTLPHLPSREFANQSVLQFVTVCVDKRRPLLARPEIVSLLLDSWRKADRWLVGRYVVMPDHVHLFCAPATMPITPLKQWVYFWRADATRRWPPPDEKPIWQKDFFDRQLRHGESYRQKWLLSLGESHQGWSGQTARRLAVSGRTQHNFLA
jgi:putative transposase